MSISWSGRYIDRVWPVIACNCSATPEALPGFLGKLLRWAGAPSSIHGVPGSWLPQLMSLAGTEEILADDTLNWTPDQSSVIAALPTARLIVDAGPGTGKTATLCARIAWLIQSAGLEPGEIWIISFTRTAVAEIRNRVSSYLGASDAAHGIRVATIDSHAWAMNVGFTEVPVLSGSFDDNIRHVIEVIRSNEHAAEYIGSVRHLLIDEAQDVVGPRVEFVLELMHAMSPAAGVTVLCDEAQAIYEYTEDDAQQSLAGTLVDNIRQFMPEFEEKELTEIHRTGDPKLKEL